MAARRPLRGCARYAAPVPGASPAPMAETKKKMARTVPVYTLYAIVSPECCGAAPATILDPLDGLGLQLARASLEREGLRRG